MERAFFCAKLEEGMFVRRAGNPQAKQTLLWIHGLGESGLCFENIARHEKLSAFYHIIPDMPGYGRSFNQDKVLSIEETVTYLSDWLSACETPPVVLIGHSLGGVIGQLLCEKHPEQVERFVNIEGNISLGDCSYSKKAKGVGLEEFKRVTFPKMLDEFYLSGCDCRQSSGEALRGYYTSCRLCDIDTFYRHSRELTDISETGKLAERLANLKDKKPVYIHGTKDGVCQRSLELLNAAGVKPFSITDDDSRRSFVYSGHWPFIDQPDKFAQTLAQLLKS